MVTQSTPELSYFVTVSRLNFGGNDSSPALRFPFDRYVRLWYGTGTPVTMNLSISADHGFLQSVSNSFTLNFVLFDVDSDGENNSNSRSVDIYNADLTDDGQVYAGEWLAQAVDVPKAERKVV
ncbi:hypothetical protein R1sor_022142 [Riccia sorocarpa]|uniref:Legume lectin domain-containing protein n=1 Tax=Riccia sorocarpa TaxID=122646 RepID=A0ABD3GKR4_9MARC